MKKYLPIAFLSIAFVLLLLFLYVRKSETFVEDRRIIRSTPSPIEETSLQDWQTYRNEKYGFEFQYPNFFEVSSQPDGRFMLGEIGKVYDFEGAAYGYPIQINFAKNPFNLNINNLFERENNQNPKSITESIKIDGRDAIKIINGTSISSYVLNQNYLVYLSADLYRENSFVYPLETIYNQILSTIKFSNPTIEKPTPTTTWKTYKNDKYGFEFQYPSYLSYGVDSYGRLYDPLAGYWRNRTFSGIPNFTQRESFSVDLAAFEECTLSPDPYVQIKQIEIDGYPAQYRSYTKNESEVQRSFDNIYFISKNNQCFVLSCDVIQYKDKDAPYAKFQKEFDDSVKDINQILSTFKFTK